ncbi:NADP-dependent oxidoreductase [Nocardia sp. NPDC052566]|uniref:NADP-dependent oxidoreductase n=1 Tax=Nocardia sp. NPDC052566 TaxID=3364330 RepID=UPI0037C6A110
MRAISQEVLGGPEVLTVVELDRPALGPTDILVRVHAAGVNPTDWLHRTSGLYLGAPPFVLGWDVSGVVEAVGVGVTLHKPGDEVFGMLDYPRGTGAYAEYVAAPSRNFVRKPANIDHAQAAALPVVALTAWQALVDTADVRPGQRVLIHAAAGGVGHVAVQIAKARGAYVIGTASAPKHDFVRGLGADEVIDYARTDFADAVHDIDVVLDAVGGDYAQRSLRTLRPGGILVAIVFSNREQTTAAAEEHGVRLEYQTVEADHAGMTAIAALVDAGLLHVEVAATLPLEQAADAHRHSETRRTTGKLVLTV